jgi:glutathione synthase/RimK-type ligase-like ATP-grasp enzyme
MQEAGVSVPHSWGVSADGVILPGGYSGIHELGVDPLIGRPVNHSQGRQLFTGGWGETVVQVAAWGGGYISELIHKVKEYRVFVVSGRVSWVAEKTPDDPTAVAWNVASVGHFSNVRWGNWPMAVIEQSLKAMALSHADFGAVDVIVDADGKAYVLEINSAPGIDSEYRRACTAKCFDYIVTNGREHFEMPTRFRSWKDVIHPELREE